MERRKCDENTRKGAEEDEKEDRSEGKNGFEKKRYLVTLTDYNMGALYQNLVSFLYMKRKEYREMFSTRRY